MRVHRHLDKADSREALGWIYRIATNYCLNEIRNRKRRAALDARPRHRLGNPPVERGLVRAANEIVETT